jgi:voltage-gated potassium channel
LFDVPLLRRIGWHIRRIAGMADRRFFRSLLAGLVFVLLLAASVVWIAETDRSTGDFGASFYWAVTTVMGQGDASYATGPAGWLVGWFLGLFGVAIVAAITGALVGFLIDFLLKEGQGMGAAGFRDHIVICGWNSTARDLVDELLSDDYKADVVLVHDVERNPAEDRVYFVRGSTTNESDLRRAGIETAASAIICPVDTSDAADMHSILTVLAIEHIAPQVRTVVEVNNPEHAQHFRRAEVDELLVTSRLASRLLARSALYPGLTELATDIVSGGEGSELYRVVLPDECVGLSIDDLSAHLRREHQATLLSVSRDGVSHTNPRSDFVLERGDNLVVVAESLGGLHPLENATADA